MPNFARVLSAAEARARQMTMREQVARIDTAEHQATANQITATANYYQSLESPTQVSWLQNAYTYVYYGGPMSPALMYTVGVDVAGTNGLQAAVKTVARVVEMPSREMLKREAVTVDNVDASDARQILARDAEALLGYAGLREEVHMPGRLRGALAKLDIQILDEKSVDAYKKQMTEHFDTAGKMVMPTWRLKNLREYKQPVPEFVLSKAVEIKKELPEAEFYIDQLAVDPFLIVSLVPLVDFNYNKSRGLDPEMSAYIEVWDEPKFEGRV